MKWLMKFMMLSCLKATELIEKKILFRLSQFERLKLYYHTKMCEVCAKYENQSVILHETLKKSATEPISNDEIDEKTMDSIKKAIVKKLDIG